MKNVVPFRNFSWLKKVGATDARCEKILKAYLGKDQSILVIGSVGSGKNTVANALVAHLHERQREPILLPTLTETKVENFAGNEHLNDFKRFLKLGHTVILPLGYTHEYHLHPYLPGLPPVAEGFGIIVDVRLLPDGHRQIAQIFSSKNQKLQCIYRSAQFSKLQLGLVA